MPIDDVRLSKQQRALLRWIAEQVHILANLDDPDAKESLMVEARERAKVLMRAKNKTIRWSANRFFGPHHVAYKGVSDAERSSLSRSLKKLQERGFIKRLDDGRIQLTSGGHRYLISMYFGAPYLAKLEYDELTNHRL